MVTRYIKLSGIALILASFVAIGAFIVQNVVSEKNAQIRRLEANQTALLDSVKIYQNKNGELTASVQVLTLRRDELESLIPSYKREIADLGIRLKEAERVAEIETKTEIQVITPVEALTPKFEASDTIQTPTVFQWSDDWAKVQGEILTDSIRCTVQTVDSLILVVHRERRKCIFRKQGKIKRFEVVSKSPHTEIVGVQMVELIE